MTRGPLEYLADVHSVETAQVRTDALEAAARIAIEVGEEFAQHTGLEAAEEISHRIQEFAKTFLTDS